jgi:hypothetical protein
MPRLFIALMFLLTASCGVAHADPPKKGKLPHVEFDVDKKQVRVECEALNVNAPLEFFCCVTGTNEHESVLRTPAKPSDIQIGLLAIGLKPGEPITYSEALNKWLPPHGPPLHMSVEFEKDGKTVSYPANRWLRDVKSHKECPSFTWVFTGSRVMQDGKFAADVTGYVVSVVNFDLTLIDIPELRSSDNETLEWERNPDLMPKNGTKVWMVIEPTGANNPRPAGNTQPAAQKPDVQKPEAPKADSPKPAAQADAQPAFAAPDKTAPSTTSPATPPLSDVQLDEKLLKNMQQYWDKKVSPHSAALREAAEAHYEVMGALRREQQRLIDEADRIQRAIDKLEKDYQNMTTPRPGSNGS